MKKLIFGLFFVVAYWFSFAQSSSEHLTFKGVPIDGTLSEYISKMKSVGFHYLRTEKGKALLNGEFAGYSDCIIEVKTLKKQDLVHEIVVLLPVQDKWRDLNYVYSKLKSMLSKKYGEPAKNVEKFVNTPTYINLDDENDKWFELQRNHCKYYSVFNAENGTVSLSIENEGVFKECRVKLWYSDKLNSEVFEDAAMDDL